MTRLEMSDDEGKTPPPKKEEAARAGDDEAGERDEGRTAPFGWVSILIIVTLVVGTWFLIQRLSAASSMQDCIQSGRRNCAPIDDPNK
jgi:hypothetical protein